MEGASDLELKPTDYPYKKEGKVIKAQETLPPNSQQEKGFKRQKFVFRVPRKDTWDCATKCPGLTDSKKIKRRKGGLEMKEKNENCIQGFAVGRNTGTAAQMELKTDEWVEFREPRKISINGGSEGGNGVKRDRDSKHGRHPRKKAKRTREKRRKRRQRSNGRSQSKRGGSEVKKKTLPREKVQSREKRNLQTQAGEQQPKNLQGRNPNTRTPSIQAARFLRSEKEINGSRGVH